MEYSLSVDNHFPGLQQLKQSLSIEALPTLCRSIDKVLEDHIDHGVIYCVWGQFDIKREELGRGVKFTLLTCPNGFAWSIIQDDQQNRLHVQCTTDHEELDPEFVESIYEFTQHWCDGLNQTR